MMKNKYKVLIKSCWILLFICCAFKLFGADIFIAGTSNENFIKVCTFIEENIFIKYILYLLMNIVSSGIYFMAVLSEKKINLKWLIPYGIYAVCKIIFNSLDSLFMILDFIIIPGLPIIINPKIWKRSLLGTVLNLGFQFVSMFLKLDNFTMFDENTLIFLILNIDYYIMLVLYYLYSNFNDEKEIK